MQPSPHPLQLPPTGHFARNGACGSTRPILLASEQTLGDFSSSPSARTQHYGPLSGNGASPRKLSILSPCSRATLGGSSRLDKTIVSVSDNIPTSSPHLTLSATQCHNACASANPRLTPCPARGCTRCAASLQGGRGRVCRAHIIAQRAGLVLRVACLFALYLCVFADQQRHLHREAVGLPKPAPVALPHQVRRVQRCFCCLYSSPRHPHSYPMSAILRLTYCTEWPNPSGNAARLFSATDTTRGGDRGGDGAHSKAFLGCVCVCVCVCGESMQ